MIGINPWGPAGAPPPSFHAVIDTCTAYAPPSPPPTVKSPPPKGGLAGYCAQPDLCVGWAVAWSQAKGPAFFSLLQYYTYYTVGR